MGKNYISEESTKNLIKAVKLSLLSNVWTEERIKDFSKEVAVNNLASGFAATLFVLLQERESWRRNDRYISASSFKNFLNKVHKLIDVEHLLKIIEEQEKDAMIFMGESWWKEKNVKTALEDVLFKDERINNDVIPKVIRRFNETVEFLERRDNGYETE